MTINGYLSIWKPPGPTSFDIVRRIRRASGIKRVGHGGTLDPAAEGILPILLGAGTRMSEELERCAKTYEARILLGIQTDTLDMEGRILEERNPSAVTREDVLAALPSFRGTIQQVPPMFSALKHSGRRLYDIAREGKEVEREAREVTIYAIEIVDWSPPRVTLAVTCGRGTYIRSLAADLGEQLGCGATLEHLQRTRVGPFTRENAYEIDAVEMAFGESQAESLVMPLTAVFPGWPALRLNQESVQRARTGALLGPEAGTWDTVPGSTDPPFVLPPSPEKAVALDTAGKLVALLTKETQLHWHPRKVLTGVSS